MIWSRHRSRQRKAVVTALSAVGENGMSLLALSVAVNIPEPSLQVILNRLVDSGQVSPRTGPDLAIPGPRAPRYQLVSHPDPTPPFAVFSQRRSRAV
ncbi:MAG: hypothetical protein P8Z68_12655 [Kineosporiaceae bacterium]|jgi:hypothetical protein